MYTMVKEEMHFSLYVTNCLSESDRRKMCIWSLNKAPTTQPHSILYQ